MIEVSTAAPDAASKSPLSLSTGATWNFTVSEAWSVTTPAAVTNTTLDPTIFVYCARTAPEDNLNALTPVVSALGKEAKGTDTVSKEAISTPTSWFTDPEVAAATVAVAAAEAWLIE